jgi:beta-lactamase class A
MICHTALRRWNVKRNAFENGWIVHHVFQFLRKISNARGIRKLLSCRMRFSVTIAFGVFAAFAFSASSVSAQTELQHKIGVVSADARGHVSVACSLPGSDLNCDLNPHARPPMQSVFKLPLTIVALHLVEVGKLSLDQTIRFLPSDRILPHTYSPLQDKYPEGNVDVPLHELLRLAASLSDNTAADIVLRIIGGPQVVESYVRSLGIGGFHLEDGEHGLNRDVRAQYRNWFEPASAVRLLRRIGDDSPLSVEHTALLFKWLSESPTGARRIKGELPSGTIVFHKTGTSNSENGVAYATNDIGLIHLPDGRRLAIAIFLTDCRADEPTRDAVIARIANAAYEAAVETH